jgi:hypothetical protein
LADQATHAQTKLQADLGYLSGLARTGFTGDNDNLIGGDRLADFFPPC